MGDATEEKLISLYKSLKNQSGPKLNYKCEICSKVYQRKESILKHVTTKHSNVELDVSSKGKTEYCHLCDKDFPTSAHKMPNFKFHIVTAHANIVCGAETPDAADPTATEIECKECLKRFTTKVYFRHHWETHRIAKESVSCTICDKTYPNMYLFKVHESQTHQDCVCEICDKVFSGKLILRRHMMRHESQFVCNHCHKAFEDEESHKKHIEEHLKTSKEKTIICEICGLTTAYQNVMRRHFLSHNSNSRSICDLCGKSFKTINTLQHHKSTIHVAKQFCCKICSASFAQKSLLTKHVKLRHTRDKTLFDACPYCQKLMSKYQMVTHLLKHTKESPFECHTCKDRFRAKRTLVRHQVTFGHQ